MPPPVDPIGNVSLGLQVAILFLLIVGLPSVKGRNQKKIASRHGYLTFLALVLHTALIFLVMIPSFSEGLGDIGELPLLYSFNVWGHVFLGTLAEIMGIIIVGYWLLSSPGKMMCIKLKKWMMPLFIIWSVSLINGAIIHIMGMI